jgi:ankyrin repeat protein
MERLRLLSINQNVVWHIWQFCGFFLFFFKFFYSRKSEPLLSLLVSYKAPLDLINAAGQSCLHFAAKNSDEKILNLLLISCSKEILNLQDKDGNTALHVAVVHENYTCVALILNMNATMSIRNNAEDTALSIAISKGNSGIVELLINFGASVNSLHKEKRQPLHLAVLRGDESVVSLVLNKNTENCNAKDLYGNTPLHLAFMNKQLKIAQMLLDKGAMTTCVNQEDKSPLYYAPPKFQK